MSVHKGLFGHGMTKWVNGTALSPLKQQDEKAFSQSNVLAELQGNTFVNFSDTSDHVRRGERDIDSEPDIRLDKVYAIRQEIQSGAYNVDYDKIAENVLDVFMDEVSTDSVIPPHILFIGCTGILS